MDETTADGFDAVETHLNNNDARAAAAAIQAVAGYPRPLQEPSDWQRLGQLLGRLAGDEAPELRRQGERLAADPGDLQVLYDIGYQLFEVGLFGVAATVLTRAEELTPGVPAIISELVSAFEEMGLYDHAVELLQRHPHLAQQQLLFAYLLAFNGMLSGRPEIARAQTQRLTAASDDNERFMVARITRMLARVDHFQGRTALDRQDLRGWHLVLTGGVLLHLSSAGFDDGMNGRYAFLQDSLSRIQAGIVALDELLTATGQTPAQILLLPERGSEAVGLAAAARLGLPTAQYSPDAKGLVVAYDLEHLPFGVLRALRDHQPDQLLWAHALCWTDPPPICPDIVTLMYQHNITPWQPQLTMTPEGESERAPAVTGTAEAIAAALIAAPPLEDDARPNQRPSLWAAIRDAPTDAKIGIFRQEALRERLWYMGPVKSNRF
ncbi:MAG: hypothetical protein AAFV53_02600 [Myxococcota bacterium]